MRNAHQKRSRCFTILAIAALAALVAAVGAAAAGTFAAHARTPSYDSGALELTGHGGYTTARRHTELRVTVCLRKRLGGRAFSVRCQTGTGSGKRVTAEVGVPGCVKEPGGPPRPAKRSARKANGCTRRPPPAPRSTAEGQEGAVDQVRGGLTPGGEGSDLADWGRVSPGVSEATRAGCGRLRDARDGRFSGSSVTEGREVRHGDAVFVRVPCAS